LERRLQALGRAGDFDDLPPCERYVAEVQALGGTLRRRSAWLNAASFRMGPEAIARVARLPFVHEVRLVAKVWQPLDEARYSLPYETGRRVRREDTTAYKEFYGLAYAQNYMLGVPQVYGRGLTGAGVRLGLLDTGLRRIHPAVRGITVVGQHDFLVGDRFLHTAISTPGSSVQLGGLRDIGLAESPALHRQGDTIYLAYVADSSQFGIPVRGIFGAVSFDAGASWSASELLAPLNLNLPSQHRPALCGRDRFGYLAWSATTRSELNPQVLFGYFEDGFWRGSGYAMPGRSPDLFLSGDSLFLVSVGDSVLWFNSASVAGGVPVWGEADVRIAFDEMVKEPSIVRDDAGVLHVAVTGWRTGRVYLYRSDDQGANFIAQTVPVSGEAGSARLFAGTGSLVILWRDFSVRPLVSLLCLQSVDGEQWQRSVVADSLLGIGAFDFDPGGGVVFENEGIVRWSGSADGGLSWRDPVRIGSSEFARCPLWQDSATVIWVESGDTTVGLDSGRFGANQPDHGTRMASIIAAFRRGAMVGVAPGVEFLVAKTEFHSFRTSGVGYEFLVEEDNYIAGLEWAERHGADIVSSSLGYTGWYERENLDGRTAPISVAAARAVERGVLVVTAMGNRDTTDPAKRWPNPYIVAPGDAFGVITVGGIEKNFRPWHTPGGGGTGCGPTIDGRHKPELVAMGDSVTVVAPDSSGNVYEGSSGTSGATALVAGCCALLREAHPDWSAIQIRDTLFRYASQAERPDDTFGFGVPNVATVLERCPPDVERQSGDALGDVYPNPLLAGSGREVLFPIILMQPASLVQLSVFDMAGRLIDTMTLRDPRNPAQENYLSAPGRYTDPDYLRRIGAVWDGRNWNGAECAAGLYYAVLQTGTARSVRVFGLVR
jgi:hypothetical protein